MFIPLVQQCASYYGGYKRNIKYILLNISHLILTTVLRDRCYYPCLTEKLESLFKAIKLVSDRTGIWLSFRDGVRRVTESQGDLII